MFTFIEVSVDTVIPPLIYYVLEQQMRQWLYKNSLLQLPDVVVTALTMRVVTVIAFTYSSMRNYICLTSLVQQKF